VYCHMILPPVLLYLYAENRGSMRCVRRGSVVYSP
jgi:hypothetical protein